MIDHATSRRRDVATPAHRQWSPVSVVVDNDDDDGNSSGGGDSDDDGAVNADGGALGI